MARRVQLSLEDDQYRWLEERAGPSGSIASVVRELIDAARADRLSSDQDPLVRYLLDESPAEARRSSTVEDLDLDVYGR